MAQANIFLMPNVPSLDVLCAAQISGRAEHNLLFAEAEAVQPIWRVLPAKKEPARIFRSGPAGIVAKQPLRAAQCQAEIFLVAAAMLSRAAFKVLRDVAMFMRIWFAPPRP